jgi:hypothetical protein
MANYNASHWKEMGSLSTRKALVLLKHICQGGEHSPSRPLTQVQKLLPAQQPSFSATRRLHRRSAVPDNNLTTASQRSRNLIS